MTIKMIILNYVKYILPITAIKKLNLVEYFPFCRKNIIKGDAK